MELRLLPVNALLALCTSGDMNPSPLADAGFRVAALEVPVGLDPDKVVVDVVLIHSKTSVLVACEAKAGANIEAAQAVKYSALDAQGLVHASSADLRGGHRPTVTVLYAALAQNVDRIRQGLASAGVGAPVLGVARGAVQLHDPQFAHPLVAAAFGSPIGLPWGVPRIIACDHESPADVVLAQVKAVLVAHSSRRAHEVSAEIIAAETLPSLPMYGKGARMRFVRTVTECMRNIAAAHPETYEFRGRTANHDPLVRFLKTPEDNDNRGRTQAYQALARDGHTRRRTTAVNVDQLDLLRELGATEDDGAADQDRSTEEERS